MMRGLFITFEGLDGSGKTTQIGLLEKYLEGRGFEVISTIEPGGTPVGNKIRDILLDKNNTGMSYRAETLLFEASRAELVSRVISPALSEGKIVICDRFFDSTIAYQGIARGLGSGWITDLSLWATGGLQPDITFLLSLEVDKGEKRFKDNYKPKDRIESEKEQFKEKIYRGYLSLAEKFPGRITVIDGSRDIGTISSIIKEKVDGLLSR
ncbi:MAG: dTMP kinase [Actinobacteria bacterium]|nr:dTMP kinase [Actinomycetota bacterium]